MNNKEIRLNVQALDFTKEHTDILHNIDIEIHNGEFVGLIGPNGCGKTTLLKNIYRVYNPTKGAVYLDGKNLKDIEGKEAAKKMAVLIQDRSAGFDFPVIEIVLMGRYAHKKFMESNHKKDYEICERALEQVGLLSLRERSFLSLSGGEKQRVLLAAVLAQESKVILLDEPTNHLDIGYQLLIIELIKKIEGLTVFASLHDINLAAKYCDRIIAMNNGRIIADGKAEEVLTEELIENLFHVKVNIDKEPYSGRLNIIFLESSWSDLSHISS
jgi:iron complex transport system ATP-binding protein